MRVLIVSPISVLPNTAGVTNRIIELAKCLNKLGSEASILHAGPSGVMRDGTRLYGYPSFETLLKNRHVIERFLDLNLGILNSHLSTRLFHLCRRLKPNLIQFEFPMAFLSNVVIEWGTGDVPKVLDEHNVQSLTVKHASSVPFIFPYVLAVERIAVRNADFVCSVSARDKETLCHLCGIRATKVGVVPNGVNIKDFSRYSKSDARRELGLGRSVKVVFFHGYMDWRPNREALRTILSSIVPAVRSKYPSAVFFVAGQRSERFMNISTGEIDGVRLLGFVRDLPKYIIASDVCIAPLISGGGTSLKVLQYMAAKKPVVTTDVGARGLPILDGEHAIVRNDLQQDFPEAIVNLLECQQDADRLGNRAGNLALNYDWEHIGRKLYSIYSYLLN